MKNPKKLSGRGHIEIDSLTKTFASDAGDIVALDGIDFDIASREFVGVVGPSGCGKSTLLRCIGGLVSPSRGSVRIGGEIVSEPDRRIGYVFQQAVLLPWRTVHDNVVLPFEVRSRPGSGAGGVSKMSASVMSPFGIGSRRASGAGGVSKMSASVMSPFEIRSRPTRANHEKADEVLEMVGLSEYRNHRPTELSGGMQQRVSVARALAMEPSILLMDEPFGALDAQTRDSMNLELLRIWKEARTTVLFVTHDIGEALFLSDRVIVMSARPGRVQDVIDVDIARPRTFEAVESSERFWQLRRRIREQLTSREQRTTSHKSRTTS